MQTCNEAMLCRRRGFWTEDHTHSSSARQVILITYQGDPSSDVENHTHYGVIEIEIDTLRNLTLN